VDEHRTGDGDDVQRALGRALTAVGDRWSLAVVAALLDGAQRYGELQERLGSVAPNVLSRRLKQLEDQGLLSARPYSERPPRYRYELTDTGRDLAGAVRLLADWGSEHGGEATDPPRHATCGTPLQTRWFCPTCDEVIDRPGLGEPPDDELLFA
jgi:DNA-binding HxlR family transcriptional regulator